MKKLGLDAELLDNIMNLIVIFIRNRRREIREKVACNSGPRRNRYRSRCVIVARPAKSAPGSRWF